MKKKILFVCIENSCRSQIAEGFARRWGGETIEAYSSGSKPSGTINPTAIEVMKERGIDLTRQSSKGLNALPPLAWDYVITMGCGDACPMLPAKVREDWGIRDPKNFSPEEFRQVRDEIESKVKKLIQKAGTTASTESANLVKKLSWLDRFLPVWILLAMMGGVALGRFFPGIAPALDRVKVADVSLPIAVGLLWMMYPVLANVNYGSLGSFAQRRKVFSLSLVMNWVVGPFIMFGLAWLLLPDLPHYRNGLVLVGLARCIAMVLIWNMLAQGNGELAALLVAINSVFQIFMYSFLGYFFLAVLPRWWGAQGQALSISMVDIAKSVGVFLGLPLAAGFLTRWVLVKRRGAAWYANTFMPRLGPTALIGLLYTIVLMFSMQGDKIIRLPLDVVRISLPLLVYFTVMWGTTFAAAKAMGFSYAETSALAFTAAGNNFELAIAVAVGIFGIASGEALAAVVGPLIEVPALIGLVYVSLWAKRRWFSGESFLEPESPRGLQ